MSLAVGQLLTIKFIVKSCYNVIILFACIYRFQFYSIIYARIILWSIAFTYNNCTVTNSHKTVLAWGHCTTDSKCSADCLNAYFRRYASRCANMLKKPVSELTCADYVRLHHGPDGCGMSASLRHSRAITSCLWPANMFSS